MHVLLMTGFWGHIQPYLSRLGYQNPVDRGWLVQRKAEAYNTPKMIYCAGLFLFSRIPEMLGRFSIGIELKLKEFQIKCANILFTIEHR